MKKECYTGRQDHPGIHPKDKESKRRVDKHTPEWIEKVFEQALTNYFYITFSTTPEGKVPVCKCMKDDRSPDALSHHH
jgi:hypothetical protein